MAALTPPPVVVAPFAADGDRNDIPLTPDPTPGLASFELGFPPLTMTPIPDGGIPPRGRDMNGILYLLSYTVAWLQAGGFFTFQQDVADAGGYPEGAVISSASNAYRLFRNNQADNTNDPDVDPTGWSPFAHPAVSDSTVVFTNDLGPGSLDVLSIEPWDSVLDLVPDIAGSQIVSVAGVDGQVITITNVSARTLTLMSLAGGSSPEFNFRLPTDIDLLENMSMSFKYSETALRGESQPGCWIPL